MNLPIISARLSYGPDTEILKLDSLNIIFHNDASAYPDNIPVLNEYLLESHVQLVYHTTGLF